MEGRVYMREDGREDEEQWAIEKGMKETDVWTIEEEYLVRGHVTGAISDASRL